MGIHHFKAEVQNFLGLKSKSFKPSKACTLSHSSLESSGSHDKSNSSSSSGNVSNFSNPPVAKDEKGGFFFTGKDATTDKEFSNQMKPSDFEFLKVIGKGSFGKVLLSKRRSADADVNVPTKYYAIKVLDKALVSARNESGHVMAERNVLVQARPHPFLVRFWAAFTSKHKLFFVLDYVDGGELFLHLQREKRFSEQRTKFYGAEIASALGYLHSMDIIYRDLKPENILLDRAGHIKLTDFGLCKQCPDFDVLITPHQSQCQSISDSEPDWVSQLATTFCGTPEYLAPEILSHRNFGHKQSDEDAGEALPSFNSGKSEIYYYDRRVDWWCLGAVMYEMIFGLPPFYSRDTAKMYRAILTKPLTFPEQNSKHRHSQPNSQKYRENEKGVNCQQKEGHQTSHQAKKLLKALLQKDREQRLGASKRDVLEIQEHPFFADLDWQALLALRITPPFDPSLTHPLDFRHFDPEFIEEPVPASYQTALAENNSHSRQHTVAENQLTNDHSAKNIYKSLDNYEHHDDTNNYSFTKKGQSIGNKKDSGFYCECAKSVMSKLDEHVKMPKISRPEHHPLGTAHCKGCREDNIELKFTDDEYSEFLGFSYVHHTLEE
ncbi:serine/threonine-protein kinase Sgk2-like isoform X2 [Gordionus sp. m RMFG-2023]|uniref:serine/threonine-protein kinase Sgk2-like isoform X2 n=1 Tax=Gordionus sp. m RMFG-2023 TaxID=3053472 RepID=UPI0031FC7968